MDKDTVIKVEHVSKKYCKYLRRSMVYGIMDIGRNMLGMSSRSEHLRKDEFWALDDVSFEVKKGETLGIIGPNGSGKTTLLKLLNGIFWPDKGKITIKGKVRALIELGAGFHPLLTGRENIYINAAILGMTKKEIDKKFDEIVEFADIGDFIDTPVKYYSSGMFVRLGFAIAIHSDPDILLIDEILAVGDYSFQTKCVKKIIELKKNTTIIIISHNLDLIYNISDNSILINKGKIIFYGYPNEVIKKYTEKINLNQINKKLDGQIGYKKRIAIKKIDLMNNDGEITNEFKTGDKMIVKMEIYSEEVIEKPVFGISLHRNDGLYVAGFNTKFSQININHWKGNGYIKFIIDEIILTEGIYSLSASITMDDCITSYDYLQHVIIFKVIENYSFKIFRDHGVVKIPCHWEVINNIKS